MARCKQCGKRGFFLRVSKAGLCNSCHHPDHSATLPLQKRVFSSLENEVLGKIDNYMNLARSATTITDKLHNANTALLLLRDFKRNYSYNNSERVDEIIRFINLTRVNEFIRKARLEESKGHDQRASNHYLEALYLLKHEAVDEQSKQQQMTREIEALIDQMEKRRYG